VVNKGGNAMSIAENSRLHSKSAQNAWKFWGPYLSERQWGSVREDYSDNGDAWNYFSHDQAVSRAYRWGEDGLGGICDEKQRLCFALGLWNHHDPIIKERLFGLTNSQGNHGEDCKEYYFYLDSTPTHSYMKFLYKYPQGEYPYAELVRENAQRNRYELEYELIDTGVFAEDKYFDVFVEYAKAEPEDILIRIEAWNRGNESAVLDIIPQLWFRNTWSWSTPDPDYQKPILEKISDTVVKSTHPELGEYYLYCEAGVELLFTENETNNQRCFGTENHSPYVKDAFHECPIARNREKMNPDGKGSKLGVLHALEIPPQFSRVIHLRLCKTLPNNIAAPLGQSFTEIMALRRQEADEFYGQIIPDHISSDRQNIMRQALAGMLWSKQYYFYDVCAWLQSKGHDPLTQHLSPLVRNREWFHMINDDIISMPDKWEYPWYAAWDLAFHTTVLALVDVDFAKSQLRLMIQEDYLHPNGQIPAYEWNFSDVNPPVHAWAVNSVYRAEKELHGTGDAEFLKFCFHKLLMNFTWWVNRKDSTGNNVFEGGFLGLDNIGVFDRSSPLPTGGLLEQSDGTAWMVFYCLNMLEMCIELYLNDPTYEDLVLKFFRHFLWVASAMDRLGDSHDELWDEADGFFYDLLKFPDGGAVRLKVRSLVGLLPIAAVTVIPKEIVVKFPELAQKIRALRNRRLAMTVNIETGDGEGINGDRLLAVVDAVKLRRLLAPMLDEKEFLSEYGIRSLSRRHLENPYTFTVGKDIYEVRYLPAESTSGMFGGNSNWRGPIWFPMNFLLIRGLLMHYKFYGDEFRVECPTGSGNLMTLKEVAQELSRRLIRIFERDKATGKRAVYGDTEKFQTDPHWRDLILFYEYFHGDVGAGIGASHQTGWTGLVARLIQFLAV
jgi:hypothetical protein